MRRHYLLLLFAPRLLTPTVRAQYGEDRPMRTLLGNSGDMHHGGWAAPEIVHSRMFDQDVMLVDLPATAKDALHGFNADLSLKLGPF